jgi:transposase
MRASPTRGSVSSARVVAGGREAHFLAALRRACQERGGLKARGRQRPDATHVLGVVRARTRLILVGETLRHALEVLAEVVPDWLRGQIRSEWAERYGRRYDEIRLPQAAPARQERAAEIGREGSILLAALYAPRAPPWLRRVPAVQTLRRVWVQQYYRAAGTASQWRREDTVPPAAVQINAPYDPDTRYSLKRTTRWAGYKGHVTETCDEDTPHLLTDVQTTVATPQDVERSGARRCQRPSPPRRCPHASTSSTRATRRLRSW